MANRTPASPATNAIASGAVSGAIIVIVIVLMDRFIFSGRESVRHGFVMTLVGGAIMGAILGAAIGVIVYSSRSLPAGVAAGAVLFAALKFSAMGWAGGGFTAVAVVMGLIYGALFGWAVSSSVVKSMEQG